MPTSKVYEWIHKQESRSKILMTMRQPLTGKQISKRIGIPADSCSHTIATLSAKGLLYCLNLQVSNSRLYWLTDFGQQCRKQLHQDLAIEYEAPDLPNIDWSLYGWLCFSHRSAVIKTMTHPLQPAEIKRILRNRRPQLKISANNVRDVVKLFVSKGLAQPIRIKKKAHLRYELTNIGITFQKLLIRV